MTPRLTALRRGFCASLIAAVSIAGTSCSDTTGPNPGEIPQSQALVSAPSEPAVHPGGNAGSLSIGTTYVSMVPGTESEATSVSVTNSEDGASVVTEVEGGGFDPIAIRAQPDDSLIVAVTGPGGVSVTYAKVPRRSRPVVVRTTPATRRTDVVLNPVIHVVFNEPMDVASLRDAVRLRRGENVVPGTVSAAGVGDDYLTAVLVPAEPLEPNAEYELQVTAAARSRAGTPIAEPVAVAFTTGSSTGQTPTTGTLIVTTTTTGSETDPNGYALRIGGAPSQSIGVNGTITAQVSPGTNLVTLSDVAGNCTLAGNSSVAVSIVAGTSVTLLFTIRCGAPAPGALRVTTSTTGPGPGGTPYTVSIDGASTWPIGGNATITIPGLDPGGHRVTLSGLGGNCAITGKPSTPTMELDAHYPFIPDGGSVEVVWEILCLPPASASLTVNAATSGVEIDPDGYELHIAGVTTQRLAPNGSVYLPGLAAGTYQLELRDLSANCAMVGHNPRRTVSLAALENTLTLDVTCTPDFRPSGRIAFTRDLGNGRSAIFIANPDGTGISQVTDGNWADFDPAWSADGTQLAFIRLQEPGSRLYTVNADGSGLTLRYAGSHSSAPTWSADGRRIAIATWGNGEVGVHIVNLDDGTISARLGHPNGWSSSPDWSPDGTRIAFTNDWNAFDFAYDVFVMNADGTNIRDVIFDRWDALPITIFYFSADWSPDGSKLLVSLCPNGFWVCWPDRWIAVANSDGSGLTRIAYDGTAGEPMPWVDPDAVWSPDGTMIAYHSTVCRGARRCIRYVRSGGGGSSVTLEDAYDPAWRP